MAERTLTFLPHTHWDGSRATCEGDVRLWKPVGQVARCRLDETEVEPLEPIDSQTVRFAGHDREAVTPRIDSRWGKRPHGQIDSPIREQ